MKTLDWKYYLQFILPMKFKSAATNCTWTMWGGQCFSIKYGG